MLLLKQWSIASYELELVHVREGNFISTDELNTNVPLNFSTFISIQFALPQKFIPAKSIPKT